MKLKKLITHPATLVTSGLGLLGIAIKPAIVQALFAAVWGSAGTLFTATSIAAFSLVPNIPTLSPLKPLAVTLAILTGVVYLAKLLDKVYDKFQQRI